MNDYVYILDNSEMIFLIIRQMSSGILEEIASQFRVKTKKSIEFPNIKKKVILVFDFWNISDTLNSENQNDVEKIINEYKPKSIVIKHCLIKENFNLYKGKDTLKLEGLYLTDELYSMSPNLGSLFNNIRAKKLMLKKIKINSKKQLNNFFDFIKMIKCEELILDDIFIELILKEKEDDDKYNELTQYFSYKDGKIIIKNDDTKEEFSGNIKSLKLIDSPLFSLPDENEIFKNISKYKNISLDIDENSLLNPEFITKFKIKNGLSDICYDLDSFKIYQDEEEDYIFCMNYLFEIILNNNNNYRKIKFKNFDITKAEYVIGYNNIKIKEENWILNKEEKKKKNKFEEFDEKIKGKIKNIKLKNIKELIFDNCTNYFIELILSMTKYDLDLLKIKKCAKGYLNINSNSLTNISHLYLFDTPITFYKAKNSSEEYQESEKAEEEKTEEDKNEEIKIIEDRLTLKIVSLEHYCQVNNLNFFFSLVNLRDLIKNSSRKYICFEMNALPLLMLSIIEEQYPSNDKDAIREIKPYYPNQKMGDDTKLPDDKENKNERPEIKEKNEDRINWANKMNENELSTLKNKKIILKKNNIRNKLENFHFFIEELGDVGLEKEDKNKGKVYDFGKDIAYLDIDYQSFFKQIGIKEITLENCLFTNYINEIFKSKTVLNKLPNIIKDTFDNFIDADKNKKYIMDMKTLKEIVMKNNCIEDFAIIMKICSQMEELANQKDKMCEILNIEKVNGIVKFFKKLREMFEYIKKKRIKIIINNIIELKEFCCLRILSSEEIQYKMAKNKKKEKKKKDGKEIEEDEEKVPTLVNLKYNEIKKYFVKENNEEEIKPTYTIFNYYYLSPKDEEYIDQQKKKSNKIGSEAEIEINSEDPGEIIFV